MVKDSIENYDIGIIQLKNQTYNYTFHLNNTFFDLFEQTIIEDGVFEVNIVLEKTDTMIQLHFQIEGTAKLICDRSLEIFDYPINLNEFVIFKFGEEEKQLSDEIEVITKQKLSINIAQYLFEFVNLAIPMKRLHPKFEKEVDDDIEDNTLFYSSSHENASKQNEDIDEGTDPRWSALKKLKS